MKQYVVLILLFSIPSWNIYGQNTAPLPVSYICIEVETGMVLTESNADIVRPPASMVKMMEMLLVEEGARDGKWRFDQELTISKHASGMGGTQVFLKEGEVLTLEKLMTAISVLSANDAAVAVAEGLWGNVAACLEAMNKRAELLGMENTRYYSVNGLPPDDKVTFDQTTAREMAILARALLEYPNVLRWTSTKKFALRPQDTPRDNTNKLLETLPGCDGLKTGYIRAAGFCLTATAKKEDIRLVSVVMGSDKRGRFSHSQSLLEEGFNLVQRIQPIQTGMPIGKPIPVEKSMDEEIRLLARDPVSVIVRKSDMEKLTLEITAPVSLQAPVMEKAEMGLVRLMLNNRELGSTPLLIDRSVEKIRMADYGFGCMGRKE